MSTVRPCEVVNGCTDERKEIRRMKYLIVYFYIVYTYLYGGGGLLGVAEPGGKQATEVVEEVLF